MDRPNREQIEKELEKTKYVVYGSTVENEYHRRLELYVTHLEKQLLIHSVVQQSEPLIDIHGYVGELNGNCRKCGQPEGMHEL